MAAWGSRRKRGSGSIYEYADGRCRAQISLKDATGKSFRLTEIFDSEAEAEEWLSRTDAAHHGGPRQPILAEPGNVAARFAATGGGPASFAEFMSIWMQYKYSFVESPLSPHMKTLTDYESAIRLNMLPVLGAVKMSKLHWDNIADWIKWLRTHPSQKTGKPLSKSAQRRMWVIFKQAMKYATAEGYVPRNPIGAHKGIEMPPSKVRKRAMTKPDFHKFQDLIRQHGCNHEEGYCELRWEIAITLARRQGEVLALSYSDFFLSSREQWIEVNRHLIARPYSHGCQDMGGKPCGRRYGGHCPKRHSGGPVLVEGTKAGEESTPQVPLTPELVTIFKAHRAKHRKEMAALRDNERLKPGLTEEFQNLVFTRHHNGGPWSASDDYEVYKRMLQEAGVSKHYRLHDLRHSSVSYLVESTGNISTAKAIAGHKTILTTQKYVSPDMASLLKDLAKTSQALEQSKSELKAQAKAKKMKAKKKATETEPRMHGQAS